MNIASIQKLHDDHDKWMAKIIEWKLELAELKKQLNNLDKELLNEKEEKSIKDHINTINHQTRFLKELEEVINTHDIFLEDISSLIQDPQNPDIQMDHDKTRTHINSFGGTIKKIQDSVVKITNALCTSDE